MMPPVVINQPGIAGYQQQLPWGGIQGSLMISGRALPSLNVLQKKPLKQFRDDTHMTSMKIFQFSKKTRPLVHLRPKFFHLLDLGRPIPN